MRVDMLNMGGPSLADRISSYVRGALSVKTLEGVSSIIAFVAVWQAAVSLEVPYISNLPYPGQVWKSFVEMAGTVGYWINWAASLERIFISFIIAQAVGVPLGLFMGMSRPFKQNSVSCF